MKVFVYEHMTAGQWLFSNADDSPAERASMHREGRAMLQAVCRDFVEYGCRVVVLLDGQLDLPAGCQALPVNGSNVLEQFDRLAAEADHRLIIAPETDGVLERIVGRAELHGPLLSPSGELVQLAANKFRIARYWRAQGLPTPRFRLVYPGDETTGLEFPLVVKPCDGAGSEGLQVVENASAFGRYQLRSKRAPWLAQTFCPGRSVSVALLGHGAGVRALPAVWQHLSDDGGLNYLGGGLPLPADLDQRARRLAVRSVQGLAVSGWIGVDLILGDSPDGCLDHLIEINPRLTTSYTGLRAVAKDNLAGAMLAAAEGKVVAPAFSNQTICFDASGQVRRDPAVPAFHSDLS